MAEVIAPLKRPHLFIDTETGGLDPRVHPLLSVGLVVGDDGEIRQSLELLVKHEPYVVSAPAMKVNRIDLVKHHAQALEPREVLAVLDIFVQQHFPCAHEPIILVGHNVGFDRAFLQTFYESQGRAFEPRFSHRIVDTHSLAVGLREAGKLSLENLSSSALFAHFGIEVSEEARHTALGDVLATFELYGKLIAMMGRP